VTWDGQGEPYGYGYSLLLFASDTDPPDMLRDNGSFHWTEKLADGMWSTYMFH
jgi:hypothetical protein